MKNFKDIMLSGMFGQNPVLVQMIGLCSVLAITTSVQNAIGMGLAVTFVVTASNLVISALRNFIPDKVRIPAYIVIIATFVTIVEMVTHAYVPALYESLGLFIPLIVVNCLIFGRAEGFASSNGVIPSLVDGLANGLGYTWVVLAVAAVRELFGYGSLMGADIIPEEFTIGLFSQAPGAFIVLGLILVAFNAINVRNERKKRAIEAKHEVEAK